mgnify:CR=1 FL=1
MKKLFAISLALILALGMFSVAAAEDVITIGFAQVGHESDWRAANTLDYQNTFTAENGYELLFVDADNDHTAQMEAVRNFIQQEVDYIVICPVQEAGWDVVLQEAQDAGIPVIIADRTVSADPSLYSCFIGTDSKAEGVQAGEWLAEQLDGAEANILVIEGSVGASAAIGRTEGFNEVVAEHPEWKVLDSQSGDFTQAGGQQVEFDVTGHLRRNGFHFDPGKRRRIGHGFFGLGPVREFPLAVQRNRSRRRSRARCGRDRPQQQQLTQTKSEYSVLFHRFVL